MSTTAAGPSTNPAQARTQTATQDATYQRWSSSFSRLIRSTAVDEPKSAQDIEAERNQMERDWNRCERWKKSLMTSSPMVVFMLKHLKLSGCPFDTDSIQCHPCPDTTAGGFSPDHGVLLCQNRYFNKKHMEDTLAHELIHAFDHCKFNVDWRNLRHQACSEIRAGNLSGDCRWLREVRRGFYSVSKQHQACVKRRAVLSVMANPSCDSRETAERAVNEVWESCSKDTRPFDEIY